MLSWSCAKSRIVRVIPLSNSVKERKEGSDAMARDLVHIMRSFFMPAAEAFRAACSRPSTDIYRTPEGWLIKLDLAGVRPAAIGLSVFCRRLRVKCIRRDRNLDPG